MGYLGWIQDKKNGFQYTEQKFQGDYCLKYADNFIRVQGQPITKNKVQATLGAIYSSPAAYGWHSHYLAYCQQILAALCNLIDNAYTGRYHEPLFDENDNFVGVAKTENADIYGNGLDINFYYKDQISQTPEATEPHSMRLSDEEMGNIKRWRVCSIGSTAVESICRHIPELKEDRKSSNKLLERIYNIKTYDDVTALIGEFNGYLQTISQQLNESYQSARDTEKILRSIDWNNDAFIKQISDNEYMITNGVNEIKFAPKESYNITQLYHHWAESSVEITPENIDAFKNSWKFIKNRNPEIESKIEGIVSRNADYCISIGGGY